MAGRACSIGRLKAVVNQYRTAVDRRAAVNGSVRIAQYWFFIQLKMRRADRGGWPISEERALRILPGASRAFIVEHGPPVECARDSVFVRHDGVEVRFGLQASFYPARKALEAVKSLELFLVPRLRCVERNSKEVDGRIERLQRHRKRMTILAPVRE